MAVLPVGWARTDVLDPAHDYQTPMGVLRIGLREHLQVTHKFGG